VEKIAVQYAYISGKFYLKVSDPAELKLNRGISPKVDPDRSDETEKFLIYDPVV